MVRAEGGRSSVKTYLQQDSRVIVSTDYVSEPKYQETQTVAQIWGIFPLPKKEDDDNYDGDDTTDFQMSPTTTLGNVQSSEMPSSSLPAGHSPLDTRPDFHEGSLLEGQISRITVDFLALGEQHMLFLSDNGQVFGYGSNSKGQLGLGERKAAAIQCVVGEVLTNLEARVRETTPVDRPGHHQQQHVSLRLAADPQL